MATAKKAGSVIGLGAAVMLGGLALPVGAADAARGAAPMGP